MSKATTAATGALLVPQILTFSLPGRIAPKARPRFTGKTAYLPFRYREWKERAILEILCQLGDRTALPIPKAEVEILLKGRHAGDLDNLGGAILDLLVKAQVIVDDRLSCIPRLLIEHDPAGELGATILIKQLVGSG